MRQWPKLILVLLSALALVATTTTAAIGHPTTEGGLKGTNYDGHVEDVSPGGVEMVPLSNIRCRRGFAGPFPCRNIDLASFTPLTSLNSSFVNDVWGWEDPQTGKQIAIAGTFEGSVFLDVTDGDEPVYLGTLPSPTPFVRGNIWGDIRVYENTAYIGSEAFAFDGTGHGVQIVDLTQFRGATSEIDIVEANRITDVTNSHNLSLNPESGRLYVTGSLVALQRCQNGGGAALVYDVSIDPLNPTYLGCLEGDGYTHDLQCVTYDGPDREYQGREVCFASNEDTLTIYDASVPSNPEVLAKLTYLDLPAVNPATGIENYYTHQGWLSEDHRYFFLGDELDEFFGGNETRNTYIWDMQSLDDIELAGVHEAQNSSIDHNMFVMGRFLYQANYTAGLTVLDTKRVRNGRLIERGHFDVYPANDDTIFAGSWGSYPFFGDGKIIVTGSDEGIFVLQSKVKGSHNDCHGWYCAQPNDR